MSLFAALFRSKKSEAPFDPNPGEVDYTPVRPYRVLHAGLPFYSDPECKMEVRGARLVVLRCEDPRQKHNVIECMPTRKNYRQGQLVLWEIDNRNQWGKSWYVDPDTGRIEGCWGLAVEFIGRAVREGSAASAARSDAG
jgi:hypothetical protein